MQGPLGPEDFYKFKEINAEFDRFEAKVTSFMGDIQSLNSSVLASSSALKTELNQLLTVINKGVDSSSLEAYGKRIQSVSEQIKGQQAAMQSLQAMEDQLSATHKTQSQRVDELISKYASLNGTSTKVVAQKQKIAKELAGLVQQYEKLDTVIDQVQPSLVTAGNTYNRLANQVEGWKREIKELDDAFDKSGAINRFNAKAIELRDNILKGESALRKMDSSLKTAGGGPSRGGGSTPSLPNGIPGEKGIVASAGRIAQSFFALEIVREVGEAVLDFSKDVVEITAKFEKYNAILASTLGSNEAGAAAFEMIQQFASRTNFSVDEVTEAYIKLANRGLRPGQEELMRLADVANSTGKPMKDLVEAISDINNTERWSEFGIKAKTNGDKVSLTFKGVTKEVARTEAGVMSAITAFGGLPGVMGMTPKISDTLDGQLSNLGDNFDRLKTTIGGDLNFELKDLVKIANLVVEVLIRVWKNTLPIRDAFGLVVDAAKDVGRSIWGTVKAFFDLKDSSDGAAFALELLTKGFKFVSIVLVAAFSHLQLMVGGLNVLLNKAKEVANFFGADFNIDPQATFTNVINDFKTAGKRIKEIWDGTKKEVDKPIKPGAGNDGKNNPPPPPPPPDPKKIAAERLAAEKDATDRELKLLELRYAKGKITEQQYNDQKYKIQVAGINREIALLKKSGEDKADAIRDANNRLLGLEIQHVKDDKQQQEKRLKDAIDREKTQTKARLGELELMHKEGKITEAQFIEDRAQAEQKGIHNIQKLLKAGGKQKTTDFIETETELNAVAAKLAEARNKIQEKKWKDAVDAVKDALKSIDDTATGDLGTKIASLDKTTFEAEKKIKERVANRKITEEQGEIEIFELKERYLEKLAKLAEDSIADNEKRSLEVIETLRRDGLTEEQIKEITALRKAEIDKNALDKQAANADASVKITETKTQKETRAVELAAEQQRGVIEKAWELASASVAAYFEITSQFRQQDIDNLEKQKEHELELAGDNDEAKKQIEANYAKRQNELRRRQAVADKASAVFSILLNTAMGATSAAAKTVTLPLVPFIIALGALQLATVLAKPIPEFFKGKKDNYEGPGYVGDRGFEFVERRDPETGKSSFEYAAQKQLTYLGKHDRVYTHEESKRMVQKHEDAAYGIRRNVPMPFDKGYVSPAKGITVEEIATGVKLGMKGQKVQEIHLNEHGWRHFEREQNSLTEWKNNHFSYPKKKH